MTLSGFAARVIAVAVICALATSWFGWLSLPVVGFLYAMLDRRVRGRGTIAAVAATLGWLGILGAEAARGASVGAVASRVGDVLHLPAFGFLLVTLLFAAILCGSAAVIGSAITPAGRPFLH